MIKIRKKRRRMRRKSYVKAEESPYEVRKWEKVLYKKLPFPDNYSDETEFLKELRKNGLNYLKPPHLPSISYLPHLQTYIRLTESIRR